MQIRDPLTISGSARGPHTRSVSRRRGSPGGAVIDLFSEHAARWRYLYDRTLSVSVSVSETLSGLSAPVVVTVDGVVLAGSVLDMSTLALGAHTLTAAAADLAGNAAETRVVFRVVANWTP